MKIKALGTLASAFALGLAVCKNEPKPGPEVSVATASVGVRRNVEAVFFGPDFSQGDLIERDFFINHPKHLPEGLSEEILLLGECQAIYAQHALDQVGDFSLLAGDLDRLGIDGCYPDSQSAFMPPPPYHLCSGTFDVDEALSEPPPFSFEGFDPEELSYLIRCLDLYQQDASAILTHFPFEGDFFGPYAALGCRFDYDEEEDRVEVLPPLEYLDCLSDPVDLTEPGPVLLNKTLPELIRIIEPRQILEEMDRLLASVSDSDLKVRYRLRYEHLIDPILTFPGDDLAVCAAYLRYCDEKDQQFIEFIEADAVLLGAFFGAISKQYEVCDL